MAADLSRSDLDEPGLTRRRSGRGLRYLSPSGRPVTDPATLARVKAPVIPPAWQEVWRAESDSARKRAIARVVQEVAGYLGNTPAVARSSYIDPRVIESYQRGATIARTLGDLGASSQFGELATEGRPEAAVLPLLRDARRAGS
jgi:DNA topoisomerase IB